MPKGWQLSKETRAQGEKGQRDVQTMGASERYGVRQRDSESSGAKNVLSLGLFVTDSGQKGVRHDLAELSAEARWNMCGAIGSAVWR